MTTTDKGSWTIVARRARGRYFRPIAGAPVGTWQEAVAASAAMHEADPTLDDIWYVPARETQATDYVAAEDRDNVLLDNGRRLPIRWDADPAATFPTDVTLTRGVRIRRNEYGAVIASEDVVTYRKKVIA